MRTNRVRPRRVAISIAVSPLGYSALLTAAPASNSTKATSFSFDLTARHKGDRLRSSVCSGLQPWVSRKRTRSLWPAETAV